ncbi:nucleoside hydrolase [Haloarchaeobius sp. TZWSO28]|uniref:nucleoside hydrolase n=1 Tax=Haloarchaeobius sp. TZWSO28 TaxID=3446119 RepID=UPI003EBEA9C3
MTDQSTDDSRPVSVIVDTDMATDCDDAGALAMLYTLERWGEAEVVATTVNNRGEYSAGAVAAINAHYGRSDVPVGAYHGDEVGTSAAPFFADIAKDTETYGHTETTRSSLPSAVSVYRRALAAADGREVVIVSLGHLNNLYELLQSGADEHSSRDGLALVERSVRRLVVMGGTYPSGREHNFAARGSAQFTRATLEQWPTPVLFSGYELGDAVRTGQGLTRLPESNPVRRAYAGHPSNPLQNGRQSWDQTAVLAGVRDPERYWELSDPGRVVVGTDGSNTWVAEPDGHHRYLVERDDPGPTDVAALLEELMTATP